MGLEQILKKKLKIGIVGLGRVGNAFLLKLLEKQEDMHAFVESIGIIDCDFDKIDEKVKETLRESSQILPIENKGDDISALADYDIILYNPHFGDTPTEFELWDAKRLDIVISKYIAFLNDAKNQFYPDKLFAADLPEYEKILKCFAPILGEEKTKTLSIDKNANESNFKLLREEIVKSWSEYLLSEGEKQSHLPAEVFDFMKGGIPDIVFEDYMNQCIDDKLEFLVSENVISRLGIDEKEMDEKEREKEIKKQTKAYEIYKVLRNIRGMGYRAMRFLPYSIEPVIEHARQLQKLEKPLIMVITNPVDYICEIMHRVMGTDSPDRIAGIDYCDSRRHTGELNSIIWTNSINMESVTLYADVVGHHDSSCTADPNYFADGADSDKSAELAKVLHTTPAETERIQKKVRAYPAEKGSKSYLEIVPAALELIERYLKGHIVPSSVYLELSKLKGFQKPALDSNKDRGGFLSVPCAMKDLGDEDNHKFRMEVWYE